MLEKQPIHVVAEAVQPVDGAVDHGADAGPIRAEGADDFAEAIVTVLEGYSGEAPINIGSGEDVTIAELAQVVRHAVGLEAEIVFDASRPDGTPRKLLDVSNVRALGWQPKIGLAEGIADTYRRFLEQRESVRGLSRACA